LSSISDKGKSFFSFSFPTFKPTLGTTQSPQWVQVVLSLWVKQLEHEAEDSPPLVPMLKMDVSALHSLMYFYGVYLTGAQDQVYIH
jgi:hypothetical protein